MTTPYTLNIPDWMIRYVRQVEQIEELTGDKVWSGDFPKTPEDHAIMKRERDLITILGDTLQKLIADELARREGRPVKYADDPSLEDDNADPTMGEMYEDISAEIRRVLGIPPIGDTPEGRLALISAAMNAELIPGGERAHTVGTPPLEQIVETQTLTYADDVQWTVHHLDSDGNPVEDKGMLGRGGTIEVCAWAPQRIIDHVDKMLNDQKENN